MIYTVSAYYVFVKHVHACANFIDLNAFFANLRSYWEYRAPADIVNCDSLACLCQETLFLLRFYYGINDNLSKTVKGMLTIVLLPLKDVGKGLINVYSIFYKQVTPIVTPSLNCTDDFNLWN